MLKCMQTSGLSCYNCQEISTVVNERSSSEGNSSVDQMAAEFLKGSKPRTSEEMPTCDVPESEWAIYDCYSDGACSVFHVKSKNGEVTIRGCLSKEKVDKFNGKSCMDPIENGNGQVVYLQDGPLQQMCMPEEGKDCSSEYGGGGSVSSHSPSGMMLMGSVVLGAVLSLF